MIQGHCLETLSLIQTAFLPFLLDMSTVLQLCNYMIVGQSTTLITDHCHNHIM